MCHPQLQPLPLRIAHAALCIACLINVPLHLRRDARTRDLKTSSPQRSSQRCSRCRSRVLLSPGQHRRPESSTSRPNSRTVHHPHRLASSSGCCVRARDRYFCLPGCLGAPKAGDSRGAYHGRPRGQKTVCACICVSVPSGI